MPDNYPAEFRGRETVSDVLFVSKNSRYRQSKFDRYRLAGRITAKRDMGNNIFLDLVDQTGQIQLHIKKFATGYDLEGNKIAEENSFTYCKIGDMVGVSGTLGANPRGEPLLDISELILLAPSLHRAPDKFHGITGPETIYRHRERDLAYSADSRAVFKKRAEIVAEIRKYLNDRDYIEIECPVLQPIYGGATAAPFITSHNSLGQDFFLSISSELYLKRALVGGFDKVYSVSRCFRNEGISPEHNPEFTNIEFFATCATYETMARTTEELLAHLWESYANESLGRLIIDRRMSMPASDWPLSRKQLSPDGTEYAEAWEIYAKNVDGKYMEIASGASDLNDPIEQAHRLETTAKRGQMGALEYDPYDHNYIEALEQGALPWAGVGIGIDRLVMLLSGKTNIRDVIMFPTLKDK